ncbi:hypothetical protein J4732_15045 [Serratia marcescens]|uniref:Uncharacterized protein n=1 Tax=Serratia marcescens TaxID=615 RepID=A0A939NPB9_SERMA|nr:hypothetical protein [Serratia marcescens]
MQAAVTACGLMVLMTLMLIFVYLLFAVLPLFKPAWAAQAQPLPIAASSPALALGMDVAARRLSHRRAGRRAIYRLTPAPNGQPRGAAGAAMLLAKPALLARAAGARICSRWRRPTRPVGGGARILRRRRNGRPQGCSRSGSSRWRWILQRKPLKLLSLADAHRGQYRCWLRLTIGGWCSPFQFLTGRRSSASGRWNTMLSTGADAGWPPALPADRQSAGALSDRWRGCSCVKRVPLANMPRNNR